MIGLNLENMVVLRRVLEELEAKTQILDTPLNPVEALQPGAPLDDVIQRLNQTIEVVNTTINALNKSVKIN